MKINTNSPLFLNSKKIEKTPQSLTHSSASTNPISENRFFAYQDYNLGNISFGARLNRTPEDFYSQSFNQENMPDTVKKYLNEDYEERQHMPPSQLQREAYQYIKIADSVKEVKDMYPDETLFKDLRPFSETRAKRGTLLLLRWDAQTSATPIFKDKEEKDLSLYLLKKVYLEGKTLEEINKDFDKEATDEIKKELGNKDNDYFSYADLKSMGIKYPNLSYYQSFLATRDDKEYIPASRKSGSRNLSEETLEKMKEGRKNWWTGLNKLDRDEQIQKMIEGKQLSNSVYSKYQGQIMTIAAAKIGFSERLSDLFADRFNDEEFNQDFETFAEKQRAIMQEFWNKDTVFKKVYSDAIHTTIADFEEAYNNKDNTDALEKLLNKALDLKAKVLEKAKAKRHDRLERQKLAPKAPAQQAKKIEEFNINSQKDVLKAFRSIERKTLAVYPDAFSEEFLKYIIDNTDFKTKQQVVALNKENPKELLKVTDEELEQIKQDLIDKIEIVNQNFNDKYTLVAKTNDHIMNTLLYELSNNLMSLNRERGDTYDAIRSNNLEAEVLKRKDSLNRQMKILAKPLSDKEAKDFFENVFAPKMNELLKGGFTYYKDINEMQRMGLKTRLTQTLTADPAAMKKSIKYIGNFNAAIKFVNNRQNSQQERDIVFEHMVTDYLYWILKSPKEGYPKNTKEVIQNVQKQQVQNTQTLPKVMAEREFEKKINEADIDFNSIDSLKKAFKKMLKQECQFYSREFQDKITEFLLNHPKVRKEVLTGLLLMDTGVIETLKDISEDEKIAMKSIVKKRLIEANKDFDKKYPIIAQANEFSLNQTIFELTKDPNVFKHTRIDNIYYIFNNELEEKVIAQKSLQDKRYKDYSIGLNDKDIKKFFSNNFSKEILKIYNNGLKYHNDIKKEDSDTILSLIFNQMKINKENEIKFVFEFIKRYKGAVKFISDQSQPQEARDLVNEHIAYNYICEKADNYNRQKK